MMKRLAIATTAMALVLGACAQSTPYQAAVGTQYGYDEQQIESDRFLVTFTGNSLTDRETVETFLLYRAAELTLERGYDHFTVVRRDTEEDSRLVGTGGYGRYGYDAFHVRYRYFHPAYGWYGWRDPFWDDVTMREINRYEAIGEIVMGRGPAPNRPDAFEAREVMANLGDAVRIPQG